MLYAMNTRTMVPTSNPSDNEFGHQVLPNGAGGCNFVYLRSTTGKGASKVWATYGDPGLVVGQKVQMTNDTGLGHRSMPEHIVVAIRTNTGLDGKLPEQKKIALWVAK